MQAYQILYFILDLLKCMLPDMKYVKLKDKAISISLVLDQALDGGMIFNHNNHSMKGFGSPSLFDKNESLIIAGTQMSIKGPFVNLDRYADTIGDGGHIHSAWRYDALSDDPRIFFNTTEHLDATYDKNMQLLRAKVTGELTVSCNLGGSPVVKTYFAVPEEPDDVSFDRCTLKCEQGFMANKNMEFVPPNGDTQIMSYM